MIIKGYKNRINDPSFYRIDSHKSINDNLSIARPFGWGREIPIHFCEGGETMEYKHKTKYWPRRHKIEVEGGEIYQDICKKLRCAMCDVELDGKEEIVIRLIKTKVTL